MATTAPALESRILRAYEEKTPGSRALAQRAKALLSNGVTHVGRYLEPHAVYVDHAQGSRKWDVDGNEYVDYFGGHGALILGHNHQAVRQAVAAQLPKGAHYGASHALEIEWAELIHEMIPSAERIRFTNTGTEATHLGLRVARAFTGKNKIVRLAGHFHGWHDHVSFPPGGAPGILPGIVEDTLIVEPNDVARVNELLSSRDDIAALILEPTGATFGQIPTSGEVLRQLREATSRHGVLLIFDEVVTGFRCSPGGAQQFYGIRPDLTTLAKIVAGGYPGAALAGRADVLGVLDFRQINGRIQPPPVMHQGTYNANPMSAAAGIAALREIRDHDVIERANRTAAAIRDGMNEAISRRGLRWCAYGLFSDFHIYCGEATVDDVYSGKVPWRQLKGGISAELSHKIRTGMLVHGVDMMGWPGGVVSAAHTEEDVRLTVAAFEATLEMLQAEGEV
jgi:glutamate-1-semialdehyde 2,1-aminomutase